MNLYFKNEEQRQNCEHFRAIMTEYPSVRFYQPNREKAPWHVQMRIDGADGVPIIVNFWPHKMKAHRDGCASVNGSAAAICLLIEEAIDDAEDLLIERAEAQS